jgi:hypothetical protein
VDFWVCKEKVSTDPRVCRLNPCEFPPRVGEKTLGRKKAMSLPGPLETLGVNQSVSLAGFLDTLGVN